MKKSTQAGLKPSIILTCKIVSLALMLIMQAGELSAQQKPLKTADDASSALYIKPNGDVGIGTTDAQAKLDVRGNVAVTGMSLTLKTTNPKEQFDIYGSAINLNGNKLFFKPLNDPNAFIQWGLADDYTFNKPDDQTGETIDKMVIAGYQGVKIGTMAYYGGKFFPAIRIGYKGQNAMIDMMSEPRSNAHPQGLAMYVTGNLNTIGKGIEFRNSDGTDGIGFTKNTIYGAMDNQNLNFKVSGQGNMTFSAPDQRMFIRSNGIVGIMKELFVGDENAPTLKASNNGFVGIGTSNPQAPLYVNKTVGNNNDSYNKDISEGRSFRILAFDKGNVYSPAVGTWGQCSIYAVGDIVTKTAFIAAYNATFSDIRLKKDLKPSSSAQDLETLRKVQVTDYKMIDTIENNRTYKKVIAQQVQKVYPMAIGTSFRTLPDVFQQAVTVTKQADSIYTITLGKPVKLKIGDQLELKCAAAGDTKVTVVNLLDDKSFTVHATIGLEKQPGVFVYGHPATDVLTVDYEAISMLNVSATQQLAKVIDEQQKQLSELKAANQKLADENQELRKEQAATKITLNSILTRLAQMDEPKGKQAASTVVASMAKE